MANQSYKKLPVSGFLKYIDSGGSTKPWLITLQQEDKTEMPYIVKPFTLKTNQQTAATAKEVFGNILATEFDLPVPDFAITNFTKEFIDLLLTHEQQVELGSRDANWKFASQYIEGASIFNLQTDKQRLKEYDVAKLYAFDCLCYNLDRGGFRSKPNLLIDDESFWLIDHEQIFPFASEHPGYYQKVMEDFQNETTGYRYDYHLLHPVLKSVPVKQKKDLFGEAVEYLKKLELKRLIDAGSRLTVDGILTGGWQLMVSYLAAVKAAPQKFEAILLKSIL